MVQSQGLPGERMNTLLEDAGTPGKRSFPDDSAVKTTQPAQRETGRVHSTFLQTLERTLKDPYHSWKKVHLGSEGLSVLNTDVGFIQDLRTLRHHRRVLANDIGTIEIVDP